MGRFIIFQVGPVRPRFKVQVFMSGHSLGEVVQLCDRVAIVRDGKLVANESLAALRNRAGHGVTIRWRDARAQDSLQW